LTKLVKFNTSHRNLKSNTNQAKPTNPITKKTIISQSIIIIKQKNKNANFKIKNRNKKIIKKTLKITFLNVKRSNAKRNNESG
jgi:hypothetical protein